ncbi:hypothetical protein ACIGO9_31365 [Nocardia asteroides]|uniref:hypothetical protein n=1 Tax=Nocardia asteroides TaxID=1824 RepID=UPI0037CB5659
MNVDPDLVREVLGTLRPGDPLTAEMIAEQLNQPLKAVRESLQALGRNGSASSDGREFWRVSPILRRPAETESADRSGVES